MIFFGFFCFFFGEKIFIDILKSASVTHYHAGSQLVQFKIRSHSKVDVLGSHGYLRVIHGQIACYFHNFWGDVFQDSSYKNCSILGSSLCVQSMLQQSMNTTGREDDPSLFLAWSLFDFAHNGLLGWIFFELVLGGENLLFWCRRGIFERHSKNF